MIELIIIVVIFLTSLSFIYLLMNQRGKQELIRFREFVRAIKAKDSAEYEQVIPIEMKKKIELPQDEYLELNELEPEDLLKTINKDV